ncbi:hypothetical protein LPJ66_000324 [Kickxella alabastrina]|uniref:Uncharacterized protein n=1 Tax=Kickxella alabastrina TaxID=61397 RepID=A0ACC1IWA5_9FUNG|nr:hypothetical protein LPJ66_000324 [Kickxella alabastrina]
MKTATLFTLALAALSVAQSISDDHTSISDNLGDLGGLDGPSTVTIGATTVEENTSSIAITRAISSSGSSNASTSNLTVRSASGNYVDVITGQSNIVDMLGYSSSSVDVSGSLSSSVDVLDSSSSSVDASSSTYSSLSPAKIYCQANGVTMCDSSNAAGFFACTKNDWISMVCSAGNECRTVKGQAVCMDPNAPTPSEPEINEPKIPCDTLNSTMCDSNVRSNFFMCVDYEWTKMQCDGTNVCMARNGQTSCVEPAIADIPLVPCTTANATQCSTNNAHSFQICVDNYWADFTCGDDSFCLFRGGQALCVDEATAKAPIQPCTTANATRCVDEDESVFQICYENYWTNSTCDVGNVCGTKQGSAVCHDPSTPIIDVPNQPCKQENATQCVFGNESMYQICSNKLWTNLTCDGDNVCHLKDDNVVCIDRALALESADEFTLMPAAEFRAYHSHGISRSTMYSWSTAALLGVFAITFGAGI